MCIRDSPITGKLNEVVLDSSTVPEKCLDSLVAEDEACMTFTFTGLADETGLLLSF